MAALVEGSEYGLSSLESTSANKSVVYVKLTDSALRAFEEFQKIKVSTGLNRISEAAFRCYIAKCEVRNCQSREQLLGLRSIVYANNLSFPAIMIQ